MSARLLPAGGEGALTEAAGLLQSGEVVAIPTETVYGLAALPADEPLRRLLEIKRRSSDKGIQLLIDSIEQARTLVRMTEAAQALAERFWPGGLTLVLELRPGVELPALLSGGRTTVGLRLPDHDVPRRLARELGPLAASSANISGRPPATKAEHVLASVGNELPLILDGGPVRGGVSSTVVLCPSDGSVPLILREGALNRREVLAALAGSTA